jgi:serine/threonine-protein kinase
MRHALEPDTPAADVTFGFEASNAKSVLESLARSIGPIPRILLSDTDPGDLDTALVKPSSPEMPAPAERGDRYVLFGEIARGGMGAVLKGRDADLGRDLAVKVLLESHQGNADYIRRFIEEAQIGGQLQHPGIVPVYELGTFADQRPYFTMKLVKGRTLAALLNERQGPADAQSRFLGIFEQVCQTVAYAHARGVIHRDLKPTNVMAGGFGEVQVMDWGLAKVLKEGGVADEAPAPRPVELSVIRTVRSGSNVDESQAGSVLGTPAYMAPEQAEGDVEQVDRRADVFGLGSILCEILTGQPAYTGKKAAEVMRKAARGDTAEAMSRLDASGVDAELIALAKDCLAAEMDKRPRDAGVVASRVLAHRTGVQEKLHQAEITRAEETARAEEAVKRARVERDRRRLTMALAASIIGLVLLGGGGWAHLDRIRANRRADTDRLVSLRLEDATLLRGQAKTAAVGDLSKWSEATTTARDAQSLLRVLDHSPSTQRRVADFLALVKREQADAVERAGEARGVRELLDRLIEIRSAKSDYSDRAAIDARYTDAFREAGLDVLNQTPAHMGAKIKSHSPSVTVALVAALDDWTAAIRDNRLKSARLIEVAQLADPDPWRRDLRIALNNSEKPARILTMRTLANSAQFDALGPINVDLLGSALIRDGELLTAEGVLRQGHRFHPSDVWVNYNLAQVLEKEGRIEEAIRYYTAARSIRPESAHEMAHALCAKGEWDEAIAVFEDLVRRRPGNGENFECLGNALKARGRLGEAQKSYASAAAVFSAAILARPNDGSAYCEIGHVQEAQDKLDEAIGSYRDAIHLSPEHAHAYLRLAGALKKQGNIGAAIVAYRDAIRFETNASEGYHRLGNVLVQQDNLAGAIAAFQNAIRVNPRLAEAHRDLGMAFLRQHNAREAVLSHREAVRLSPRDAASHFYLGTALADLGKLDQAIAAYREAIRLKPEFAPAHNALGVGLDNQGKPQEAIAAFREAIRLDSRAADAHSNLGVTLNGQGKPDEALAKYRVAIRLQPDFAEAHYNIGVVLHRERKLNEALSAFREAIRLKPTDANARISLGAVLRDQGKFGEAIRALREAIRLSPGDWVAHDNLGVVLCDQGRYEEAANACRKAIQLNPSGASGHYNLGRALQQQGERSEAIVAYREALRLKPDYAEAHCNLGSTLREEGKLTEALDELRRGHSLGSKRSDWHYPSAEWISEVEKTISIVTRLPALLKGEAKPKNCAEALAFAQVCYEKGLHVTATRLWTEAFATEPKYAEDIKAGNRYNAACSAALGGCGRGKDEVSPDEAVKTKLRDQARQWLQEDLSLRARQLASDKKDARKAGREALAHWKLDSDLASVRDADGLAKLPEPERKEWQTLWSEVDARLNAK